MAWSVPEVEPALHRLVAPMLLVVRREAKTSNRWWTENKGGTMQTAHTVEGGRARLLSRLLERHKIELSARKQDLRSLSVVGAVVVEGAESSMVREAHGLGAAMAAISSRTVQRLETSLKRLRAGTYGRCSDCDCPIGTARLRALPFADACRDCQERRDQARGMFPILV
jgi:RNA polymerase-binding transcription factor DksA